MQNLKINHFAVWVVVILLHGLGFLWYGPLLGDYWMELEGLSMAMLEANPPGVGVWVTNTIAAVLPVYVLAWLFVKLHVDSWLRGLGYALLLQFAFSFISMMADNMFGFEPYALVWVEGGYNLVGAAITGIVLGGWSKKETVLD